MKYRDKLVKVIAHALGLYMAFRMFGMDAETQLQRYKRLGKVLEDYDRRIKTEAQEARP